MPDILNYLACMHKGMKHMTCKISSIFFSIFVKVISQHNKDEGNIRRNLCYREGKGVVGSSTQGGHAQPRQALDFNSK